MMEIFKTMNLEQTNLLCKTINLFGDGQHPVAEASTIGQFNHKYSIECIDKALTLSMCDPGDKIIMMLNEIKNKLK